MQQRHSLDLETPFCAYLGFPINANSSLIYLSSMVYAFRTIVQTSTQLGEAVVELFVSEYVDIRIAERIDLYSHLSHLNWFV